jgi:PAS domain S-box-containing protein
VIGRVRPRPPARDSRGRNRQLVELALRAGRLGAWDWDADTGEMRWTEMLEAMHGLRPGSFAGTFDAFLEQLTPADREAVRGAFQAALDGGSLDLEYRVPCADGSYRWLHCQGRLLRAGRGQGRRLTGVCADVTERKQEEEALGLLAEVGVVLARPLDAVACLNALAELLVPRLADLCQFCLLGEHGRFATVVCRRALPQGQGGGGSEGLCPPHLRSAHPLAWVARSGRPLFYPQLDEAALASAPRAQQRLLRELLEMGLRSLIAVPLVAGEGALGTLAVALADSHRRYEPRDLALLQELGRRVGLALDNARLYGQLQRALEAKDEFLGLLSHELRTPITAIYGGARMLRARGQRLPPETRERILADIEQESERLFRLAEDLLALARLELGQRAETEPVLVERIAGRLLAAYRERFPNRPLRLTSCGEGRPAAAQPIYLEQVLHNLLRNALKYSPADTPIEVEVRYQEDQVEVHVLDRGPGVPPADLERIFERFYRSRATAGRAVGGGIGLTVCKRLVETQGGHIWARPREGGGLAVAFSLPLWEEDEP